MRMFGKSTSDAVDIVLLPFLFSNQDGRKVRPALILSNNRFNRSHDVIVSAIKTSCWQLIIALIAQFSACILFITR